MRTRFLAILPAMLAMPFAPARAQEATRDDGSAWRWSQVLRAGQTIEVKGVNGGIRAERASGKAVEIVATRRSGTRRGGNVADVRFEVLSGASGVTVCAVYPEPTRASDSWNGRWEPNACVPGEKGRMNTDLDVAVDWIVRVPAGVTLAARTINGEIEARALASDIEASTINGHVTLETSGWAEAVTINGDIDIRLGSANWKGALDYRTMNGDITVRLPRGADVDLHAESLNGGRVRADVPLDITTRFRRSRAMGQMGRGGRDLYLGVMNGSITIATER